MLFLDDDEVVYDRDPLVQRLNAPKASWTSFRKYFSKKGNLKILFATSYTWLALDVSDKVTIFIKVNLQSSDGILRIGIKLIKGIYNSLSFPGQHVGREGNL